ncbi:MAG: prepilin-type N-terminal cleavage/methylation domain-containing protein [Luteolibacter sp.]
MKLNTRNTTRKSGMTLLELTVVILVLLSLISILFVGARAWKKGSDRAGCILNIRNVQQAVRGHQNMMNKTSGVDTFTKNEIFGSAAQGENAATDGYLKEPACPSTGLTTTYTLNLTYPAEGTASLTCANAASAQHVPNDLTGW